MKLSDLLPQLQAIKEKYGNLDVELTVAILADDGISYETTHEEMLTRLEVEERTTLCLIAERPRSKG